MKNDRLLSVDFFRGITMFLLIGEFTRMFSFLLEGTSEGTLLHALALQFHHHPWNGLRFWDLVQPFFMFIVGVAIPLSVRKRESRGESERHILMHALGRSGILLLMGWALYCIGPGEITFRFQNVLAQLAVTYFIAFLLRNRKAWIQLAVSAAVLILADMLYRFFPVDGFNEAFVPDRNFGAWFDLLVSGELSGGHWVSFNALPTTAHTIWGVLIGRLLMGGKTDRAKFLIMLATGAAGLLIGYALDPLTPVIKRISTSSFVIASGGWSILAMAFSYWIIEMKGFRKWAMPFAIVGMNPLFIYLFAHVGGADLVYSVFKPFTFAAMQWAGGYAAQILTSLLTWAFLWYICYWLYKRKIFIRI